MKLKLAHCVNSIWKPHNHFLGNQLPTRMKQWLLYRGALTEKMEEMGLQLARKINLSVVSEDLELTRQASPEATIFTCHFVYTRHIKIYANDILLLYARSMVPKEEVSLFKSSFRTLGNRALGNILFENPQITRSAFELAKITPSFMEYYEAQNRDEIGTFPFVWARRSIFYKTGPLLSLVEYFSPQFLKLMSTVSVKNSR